MELGGAARAKHVKAPAGPLPCSPVLIVNTPRVHRSGMLQTNRLLQLPVASFCLGALLGVSRYFFPSERRVSLGRIGSIERGGNETQPCCCTHSVAAGRKRSWTSRMGLWSRDTCAQVHRRSRSDTLGSWQQ